MVCEVPLKLKNFSISHSLQFSLFCGSNFEIAANDSCDRFYVAIFYLLSLFRMLLFTCLGALLRPILNRSEDILFSPSSF